MVWGTDAESMEQAAGIKRVLGGKCKCCGCGVCGICARNRNAWIDLFAFDALRVLRAAADIWLCAEDRRDGAELDDG